MVVQSDYIFISNPFKKIALFGFDLPVQMWRKTKYLFYQSNDNKNFSIVVNYYKLMYICNELLKKY